MDQFRIPCVIMRAGTSKGIFLKENDLRRIRFHDLRHSSAGILISNRVPLVEVQQWLGHSTIRITADLYTHLEYEIKKRSAAVMSDILFNHMEGSTNETN